MGCSHPTSLVPVPRCPPRQNVGRMCRLSTGPSLVRPAMMPGRFCHVAHRRRNAIEAGVQTLCTSPRLQRSPSVGITGQSANELGARGAGHHIGDTTEHSAACASKARKALSIVTTERYARVTSGGCCDAGSVVEQGGTVGDRTTDPNALPLRACSSIFAGASAVSQLETYG